MNEQGKKLEKNISGVINVLGWAAVFAIGIYCAVCLWVTFFPQIKNAIGGDKLPGCNYVLPGLPGVYCQGRDSEGVFYYNSRLMVSIK